MATLHVRPKVGDPRHTVKQAEEALLEKFNIGYATIAVDWNDGDDPDHAYNFPVKHKE